MCGGGRDVPVGIPRVLCRPDASSKPGFGRSLSTTDSARSLWVWQRVSRSPLFLSVLERCLKTTISPSRRSSFLSHKGAGGAAPSESQEIGMGILLISEDQSLFLTPVHNDSW